MRKAKIFCVIGFLLALIAVVFFIGQSRIRENHERSVVERKERAAAAEKQEEAMALERIRRETEEAKEKAMQQEDDRKMVSDPQEASEETKGSEGTEETDKNGNDKEGLSTKSQSNGHIIVIDPGHQKRGDSHTEPNGPGSNEMKARVTGGTRGRTTGVYEYELNLTIGLALRKELEDRGYTVYMTRETHDVNISNKERAEFANDKNADITVRIHANGAENTSANGASVLVPSSSNRYVARLAGDSNRLGQSILDSYCSATGMRSQGVQANDTMTGINWCEMPVTILEMGYMTNSSDDTKMSQSDFQKKMVQGIADGIDHYFE